MRLIGSRNAGSFLRSALATVALSALPLAAHAQQATITGRVTAVGTNEPLADARVMVVNTSIAAPTNSDGRYTLRGVPTGTVEVRVLRVGYQEQKKPVAVSGGASVTLDFSLTQAIVQLQEIVTTATGEQRRVEIGNAVTTLGDVSKRVETTPVADLAQLMVAKSAGVTVLPGAMTGAAPTIRIRGISSLATPGSGISNNPIYVVDGVRMNTNNLGFGFTGTNVSLINDIDPNEIEDVEIVKGPSAATLYGTDAANGVVVITTRKGHAGSTRWTWYGEEGAVDDRNTYPTDYAIWGHVTPAAATATRPAGSPSRCTLVTIGQGLCAQDSLTSFNVLMNPATTPNHLGHRDQYGMNAAGGSDAVRFFVSGDIQNEIGPVQMPKFAQATLDTMGTPARDEWIHPEAFQSYGFRTNLSAAFSPKFDFNGNAGFSNTNQRLPQVDNNTFSYIFSALNNPGFNHSNTCVAPCSGLGFNEIGNLGEFKNGYGGFSPAQIMQVNNENGTQRFIGSADANWRPFSWMQNQGTAGVDLANNVFTSICRFGECPNSGTQRQGVVSETNNNFRNFSAKIVSNMTWQARQNLNLKTTVGSDYTNQENDGINARGTQLPPGAQTINAAAVQTAGQTLQTVNKTLGLYAQEQASFRDRMFVTGAVRTDQNSSFGTQFQRVFYPKASLSWILSDEPFFPKYEWLNQFRLRTAYGASGVQPGGTVALQTFNAQTSNVVTTTPGATGGTDTPGLVANALGNPKLKPERSTEFEGGFESNVWNNRMHIDATYYRKHTNDALISLPIATSSGASNTSVLANLASTQNTGWELTINTTLLDRRYLGWDVTVAGSHNSNKLLSLGTDLAGKPVAAIVSGSTRDTVGMPINAWFLHPYTFADTAGGKADGIITPNEVTVGSGFSYFGYSQPRDIVSITNGFDLLNRKLRIQVLTDYKGGFGIFNSTAQFYATNFTTWSSENLANTPLWDQARNVAASSAKNPNTSAGYVENGQFWKLREVSAALTMPQSLANRLRARDAQLVFSARNLHTWTKYTGQDPEANYSTGDVQTDFSTTAPRTYFIVRANLHY
ncbi:MAG TPA: SusC/RagA family TonB-linked outer membrane protein [Gemmatimonadaceae bacterium]|nr:SusC/RagA family TonB-linked outer membrane protein [Gemmatimonadaceae bacterium]